MTHLTHDSVPWIPIRPVVIDEVELPLPAENLFGRIIRNPLPPNRPPRERECAEMLAAVLSLAPRVREKLVDWWLGDGVTSVEKEELLFEVETEGAVPGGKRDDLRIEAVGEDEEPRLLISVEVKVGAGFHRSLAVALEDGLDDGPRDEGDLQHQILHYDRWLASEAHTLRQGIVVAPTDRTEGLPAGLRAAWRCVTWGELGRRVADLILAQELAPTERFLARHLVGFIQDHLGDITVEQDELAFDDVALVRAVARMGKNTARRLTGLVAPLVALFEEVGVGVGDPGHYDKPFVGLGRSVVWRYLSQVERSPYLMAGIVTEGGVDVAVWLETYSKEPATKDIRSAVEKHLPALQAVDPLWHRPEADAWPKLAIRRPLEHLLAADDQSEELERFVRRALEQLRDSGLLEEVGAAVAARDRGRDERV